MDILAGSYIKETNFVTREIAGETIIVPVRGNVGDLDSIYTLNEIGTLIWQLIDGKKSAKQMVEAICNTYEVTAEQAEKDAIEFLNTLNAAGLIKPL
jgi:hypothetical protein